MTAEIIIGVVTSIFALGWALWSLRAFRLRWRLSAGILLLVCVGLAYWLFGGWRECRARAHVVAKQEKAQAMLAVMRDPQTVIQKLKAHLERHPQAAKGWYLLGRLYAHQHQWSDAAKAFMMAHDLRPQDPNITVNLAQSFFAKGNAADAKQARQLLEDILVKQPTQGDALALLAMDAYTHQKYDKAIDYWQRLLALLPANSEEAKAIQRAIAQAHSKS